MIGVRFIVFGLLTITLKQAQALSDDDKKEIFVFLISHITECAKENPIVDGAVETVLETGKFDAINSCFVACVAKSVEMMDDNGLINEAKVIELTEKFLSADDRKSVPDAIKACDGINEKEVSDGDKGCDRIEHLLKCSAPFIASLFV